MQFGVFNLVNIELQRGRPSEQGEVLLIEKGRTRGSGAVKYVAAYEVTTRAGTKYLQYFYRGQEGRIPKFLANVAKRGGVAARIDTAHPAPHVVGIAPPPKPLPPLVVGEMEGLLQGRALPEQVEVTTAAVAERTIQHGNDVRYRYERLGDKVHHIDPAGYKAAVKLRELDAEIQELKGKTQVERDLKKRAEVEAELQARVKQRDAMMADFNQRPLAMKLARIVAVESEVSGLKAEGRRWIAENEEQWKRYLKRHRRKERALQEEGKESFPALEFPPHIEQQLTRLKWKLRGLSGPAHFIQTKAPKLGVHENLKLIPSKEVGGITPEDGAVSYLLTTGAWPTKDANGNNSFTAGTGAALYKEFVGRISNIVAGRSFKPGWAKVFDLKDLTEDLHSHLKVKLFELAATYTKTLADRGVAMGRSFMDYAVSGLNQEAQNFMRKRLKEAVDKKKVEPEVLNEPALTWDDEGAVTRDMLKEAGAPLSSSYATPEDIIAIKDLRRLIAQKVGRMEGIGLLSRLNLVNPVDDPKGGGGLKSWDEVAQDVVSEMTKQRGPEGAPSAIYAKRHMMLKLGNMFSGKASGLFGSQSPMTPSEKLGLKEGLRALIRVVGQRQVSLPGQSAWRISQQPRKKGHGRWAKPGVSTPIPVHTDVHRVVSGSVGDKIANPMRGHTTQVPLLAVKPEVHSFWQAQSRATSKNPLLHGKAPHFDPARELDLGMDLLGTPGVRLPLHVKLKQVRAKHYQKVWSKLSKMGTWRLAALAVNPAFKDYEAKWDAAQAAAASATHAEVEHAEEDPTYKRKRIPLDVKLVVPLKRGSVTVEGVPPADVLKMANLLRRQRALDIGAKGPVVSKAEEVDVELPALLLKMRRLLKVA